MRDEDWHFTNAAPIAERQFSIAEDLPIQPERISPFAFGQQDWPSIVMVNGILAPKLCQLLRLPYNVQVKYFYQGLRDLPIVLETAMMRIAPTDSHAFTALNTAFFQDAVVVNIQREAVMEMPLHIMHISTAVGEPTVSYPRVMIMAALHSRVTVIESFFSIDDGEYFTNAVTEIHLEEEARLDHIKVQRESKSAFHVGSTYVKQDRASAYHSFSFATGASLSRTNIYTKLDGDGATCTLNGLYLADGTQHVDHQTMIEHIKPNCPSREVYKGILDGSSHGVFNGKVYVHPEAQKTDGKQSNNNLLLSDRARVDTKPQLEIFADDVKCTHGATVGRLDDVALFYMKSRGINEEKARQLLTYAFAADVLETIEITPLRNALEAMVLKRFTSVSEL
jgi:Fe-S cluster assembly protein SufD